MIGVKKLQKFLHEINSQLSNYVRGQVLVAIAVAIMFMIGLPIIGLRYAVALAITAGFLNLVPFFRLIFSCYPNGNCWFSNWWTFDACKSNHCPYY